MELLPGNNPILLQPSEPFDFAAPVMNPWELSEQLEKTMNDYGGLGLSAVQVGIPTRVFCMRTRPDVTMFNPRVVDSSVETEVVLDEGCLSFPGLVLKVRRPRLIRARFFLKDGSAQTLKFDGMTARIFLHELDHLDGKLFFKSASRLKLEGAVKRAEKAGYNYSIKELAQMRSQ